MVGIRLGGGVGRSVGDGLLGVRNGGQGGPSSALSSNPGDVCERDELSAKSSRASSALAAGVSVGLAVASCPGGRKRATTSGARP